MNNIQIPYDVFVSYRWVEPDQTWVRNELVPALRGAGLRVCLDVDDFIPGRDLIMEMTRAGMESRHAITVITPSYLDGNRMVTFEALMARRADPGALESKLIPLILVPAEQPEWLRGIIPVDWTNENKLSKEWEKLLKVLGCFAVSSHPPTVKSEKSNTYQIPIKPISDSIIIKKITFLKPREGEGVGLKLELENTSRNNIFIDQARITGRVAKAIHGYAPEHREVSFNIQLDSDFSEETDGNKLLLGEVYDNNLSDWGAVCQGRFEFEDSTAKGRQSWKYHFSIPTGFSIAPLERKRINLLFRKKERKIFLDMTEGMSPARYISHFIYKEHDLRLVAEDGSEAIKKFDEDNFLLFISNWRM